MTGRTFHAGRHAGLQLPLFSMPSSWSWGIGEIPDLVFAAEWLEAAGFDFQLLLPVNEMAPGQSSPYSAISAMAIDPLFIGLRSVEDFTALGGEACLDAGARRTLEALRVSRRIDVDAVRELKSAALAVAFDRFVDVEWSNATSRADELRAFTEREAWWLDDYALYRAIRSVLPQRGWPDWPPTLAGRDDSVVERVRGELDRPILFYQYLQWLAETQWQAARRASGGVGLFGDFPFMVAKDSADVWARQGDFRFDVTVGTPPDAFSATGQDWGLPAYRWDVLRRNDYAWLRQRARRMAALYDAYRIDHLVGFYRTYLRPIDGRTPCFWPRTERRQTELGERLLGIFAAAGPRIIAEDLGLIPDFVRQSLNRLGVPGFKVLRWERDWHVPGQPFRDPAGYAASSVAISGTHDTEPLAVWWDEASLDERRQLAALPLLRPVVGDDVAQGFGDRLRDAMLQTLLESGSDFVLLPVQDLFGWRDRINTPATISEENWTYRLPWPIDEWTTRAETMERAQFLRRHCRQSTV